MRKSKTLNIEEIVNSYLKENKLDVKLKEYDIIASWEEVLGKAVASRTNKIFINKGNLYVSLSSSVLRNELMMMKDGIIYALNKKVGEKIISNIVFR